LKRAFRLRNLGSESISRGIALTSSKCSTSAGVLSSRVAQHKLWCHRHGKAFHSHRRHRTSKCPVRNHSQRSGSTHSSGTESHSHTQTKDLFWRERRLLDRRMYSVRLLNKQFLRRMRLCQRSLHRHIPGCPHKFHDRWGRAECQQHRCSSQIERLQMCS
jgi:hypothetical protein